MYSILYLYLLTGINKPTVYTVESSRINQLRGEVSTKEYSGIEFAQLMYYCGEAATEGSLLDLLYTQHLMNRGRRTFLAYLQYILRDCNEEIYLEVVGDSIHGPNYNDDLFTIKKTVTEHRFTVTR
jgi:hypothetical protein